MSDKHSITKKYFSKISSSLFGYFLSLSIMGIVPRTLGVVNYGNFNYCTNILTKFLNLLDFRASTFFYTKISQNNFDINLKSFFAKFILIIFSVSIIIVGIFLGTNLSNYFFPELDKKLILISLIFVQLSYLQDVYISMMDAAGLTINLEIYRVISKLLFVLAILLFYNLNYLDLYTLFYAYFASLILLIIILRNKLNKNKIYLLKYLFTSSKKTIQTTKSFFKYSSPLAIYLVLSFLTDFFDRSILQLYSGSFGQGIYSFSYMISNLCFLVISPMFPIFTRELSILSVTQNREGMSKLFRKYVPLLYTLTAILCCFLFNHTDIVVQLVGGNEYRNAEIALKVLLFFPLFSVYSMLNASVIYSNSRTKVLLIVSIILLPFGLGTSYFLVSNASWCLNLGATGLAIKTILIEFVSIIIILYINSKYLEFNFYKYLMHIIVSTSLFLLLSILTKYLALYFFTNYIVVFFITGAFYILSCVLLLIISPKLFGLNSFFVKRALKKITFS
jgi:O-antigen/teichoic acid export membrane protein